MLAVPPGLNKVIIEESGSFDLSELEGKELWILRAPSKIDRSVLKELSFDSVLNSNDGLSQIESKSGTGYDLLDVSKSANNGGLEMQSLKTLVPDEFGTQSYQLLNNANTKMFILKEHVNIPDITEAAEKIKIKGARKPRKQLENMKLMFTPFGSDTNPVETVVESAVAQNEEATPKQKKQKTSSKTSAKTSSKKSKKKTPDSKK
ncbi:hypothetical protein BB561_002304 [Smittium simulii]|uniref:Uncharacterized protein n=1 Tax=Smittium simulii TaxID=133385 RepID=A0A2T9YR44_9FUNG|nr:hypothetical protein BB561_002304 [Smittium simulii]